MWNKYTASGNDFYLRRWRVFFFSLSLRFNVARPPDHTLFLKAAPCYPETERSIHVRVRPGFPREYSKHPPSKAFFLFFFLSVHQRGNAPTQAPRIIIYNLLSNSGLFPFFFLNSEMSGGGVSRRMDRRNKPGTLICCKPCSQSRTAGLGRAVMSDRLLWTEQRWRNKAKQRDENN